jgi:hypothetical protein
MNKITSPFRIYVTSIILSCSYIFSANAQSYSDLGLWCTTNFNWSINSKFSLLITEEVRFKENISQLNLFYTSGGVEYKINKYVRTALTYRATQKYIPERVISFRHRLQWDIILRENIKNWIVSYRHRLQAEVRDVYSSKNGDSPIWVSRNKFQVKYKMNKYLSPYASTEFRMQIKDQHEPSMNKTFYRQRYLLGLDYSFGENSEVGLYYFIQGSATTTALLYVIGVQYTFKL